ncbi:hypothetical protein MYCTH_2116402 [Thermothelomyces thermophilus ATCC 42464]|uniref:DNA 3'-5' helicase n=1 Tax=Thermothelomyces thermophilus (strain ATCC 42464 / BCRC 31852 / DSM 1799) TaxID=573729 RepID=G2PZK1_THET4|nr:uncharacterized protein MYCTH_2116402 [Thermothelomyces thermophilus ATCC 42464]AEO55687.1 hypothetical protein MYCTH_2116402 [Thermothelomyces thermophilus ATCC 42464]
MFNTRDSHDPYYDTAIFSNPAFEPKGPRSPLVSKDTGHFVNAGSTLSSSPAARVSARKRRNAKSLQNELPSALDTSPQHQRSASTQANSPSTTPVVRGIPLVSLRQALPDKFRAIFPYELFNAVQSKCFDTVYRTNDNLVVAAPTGSGKTAIMELAICKLALDRGNENFKIIYQAPTKALCSERARDWEKRFGHMNLKCAELTGDTSPAEMRRVGDASIIVTTPEKWDSITRKWQDHRRLLQMVELFLIDEVHILKDVRGATLEAVVSRMKAIGANVRFIALSATVPNSEDIARWLGRNHTNQQLPAYREAFGEDFRPVKLQKFVYGFESTSNDFMFDKFLDQKLPGLLSKHAEHKPILVFCFTRKSCESTAAMLAEFAADRPERDKLWPVPSQGISVMSRELQETIGFGVAFHHAGLDAQDRSAVEQGFLTGQLGVICCTSTLAVGINLPCHTVVLKGTVGFTNEKLEEYSDLEVMQMLGRAGRPQFDDSATAIILTRGANKERYQKMVSGQEILESTLHLNLIEHLNSEICLGTIQDLPSAKRWLGGTFLSARLRRNPSHYHLSGGTRNPFQIDDKLEEICERDIRQLQEAQLVTDQDTFRCTEYGRAMSKYMVEFQTMKLLLQIPRGAGMETLEPVTQTRHKVSLIVQAHLGCVQYPDSNDAVKLRRQLMIERKLVFERLSRLVRAVIDCKGYDRDSVGTKTALELARGLAAESWEGRATQLTQVPSIGPVGMRKLASKDIHTVLQLADKDHDEIERLMSRQPPFGKNLQAQLDRFPRLHMEAAVVGHKVQRRAEEPVLIEVKATLRYLNPKGPPNWLGRSPALTFLAETHGGVLVYFWRGSIRKLDKQAGLELKFSVGLRDVNEQNFCHFSCEEIVGTMVSTAIEHNIPASVFPSRQIAENRGLDRRRDKDSQDYLDNDGIDDSDLILVAEQAVVHASNTHGAGGNSRVVSDDYSLVEELAVQSYSKEADKFNDHLAGCNNEDGSNSSQMVNSEAVRLPNGKWRCNHPCSGNAPTRSGKPCSHRCCREGLDKPSKLGPQRQKRKRQESAVDGGDEPNRNRSSRNRPPQQAEVMARISAGPKAKRPNVEGKVEGTPQMCQLGPSPPLKSSSREPMNDWSDVDLDDMDIDYIDLSFMDDGNEEDILKTATTMSPPNMGGHTLGTRVSATDPGAQSSSRGDGQLVVAIPLKENDDIGNSCLESCDYYFQPGGLSPNNCTVAQAEARAFKSGANDEVLCEELSNKSSEATTSFSERNSHRDTGATPSGETKSGHPGSSVSVDLPEMTLEQSPGSSAAAEPTRSLIVRDAAEAATGDGSSKGRPAKRVDEPDWVAEFDPEFVDMFRGYVTFV